VCFRHGGQRTHRQSRIGLAADSQPAKLTRRNRSRMNTRIVAEFSVVVV
jgi:hypothetical protein